jgi:hypothetical protein
MRYHCTPDSFTAPESEAQPRSRRVAGNTSAVLEAPKSAVGKKFSLKGFSGWWVWRRCALGLAQSKMYQAPSLAGSCARACCCAYRSATDACSMLRFARRGRCELRDTINGSACDQQAVCVGAVLRATDVLQFQHLL